MRKVSVVVAVMCIVAAVCGGSALSSRSGKDGGEGDFAVYVSPNQIVTSVVSSVTIHTNVPYGAVEEAYAAVNGAAVAVTYIFPDLQGNAVAKLNVSEVKAVVSEVDSATIELFLVLKDGREKSAWQTVRVKN